MANSITGSFRNPGNWRTHPLQRHTIPLVGHAGVSGGEVDLALVLDVPKEHRPARKSELNAALKEQESNARIAAKQRRNRSPRRRRRQLDAA